MSEELYYKISDVPDGVEFLEEIELTVKWETTLEPGEFSGARFSGIEELNALLRVKLAQVLKEKHATCAHMKHEVVSHSINYGHMTSVMTGEYRLAIYGVSQRNE
jgi:hypothetical protein